MDPLTLFALANGAVAAIKKGCQLYKDIKGAAGEIKDVLKDLDEQFHGAYAAKGKTPPPAAIKQLNEEKTRVKELNKQDSGDVYFELGQHLGAFFDQSIFVQFAVIVFCLETLDGFVCTHIQEPF